MRGQKISEERKAEAIKLLRAGKSLNEVAEATGLGKSTVFRLRAEDQGADETEAEMAEEEGKNLDELQANVSYYEGRVQELLEAIADLSMENLRLRKALVEAGEG